MNLPYPLIAFVVLLIFAVYLVERYPHLFLPLSLSEQFIEIIKATRGVEASSEGLKLENRKEKACYKVDLSRAFEQAKAYELCELMKAKILRTGVQFDRLVGCLMIESDNQERLSREGYHIVPILAAMLRKPYALLYEIYTKGKGVQLKLDGLISPGERAILVDDVATTGTTLMRTAGYLRDRGLQVQDAFVFVNRARPFERANLEKAGIHLHFIIDRYDLIEALEKAGYFTPDELAIVRKDVDLKAA